LSKKFFVRKAKLNDISGILEVELEAWGKELAATESMFESRINTFPEGIFVSIENFKITGVVVTQLVNYNTETFSMSWYEATDNGYIKNTHNPEGKSVYGVNLSVMPSASHGTGTALLNEIGKLAIRLNLIQGMLGGRVPDYHKHQNIPIEEYIKKTIIINGATRLLDTELSFYKKAGLEIVREIPNYIKDPDSLDYGVLLVWKNPFYKITKMFPFLRSVLSYFFRIN
jgi:hypothetical protein